jgi:hypothetical protein
VVVLTREEFEEFEESCPDEEGLVPEGGDGRERG